MQCRGSRSPELNGLNGASTTVNVASGGVNVAQWLMTAGVGPLPPAPLP